MVDNCLLLSLFQSTCWSQHRIASTGYIGDSKVEGRCHHGVLMVDYCPLRLPCSQYAESSMGREAGGGYTNYLVMGCLSFCVFKRCMVV